LSTMAPGFVERAQAVSRLLRDHRSTYVVVSTLEAAPLHEAASFVDAITAKGFHLGAMVLNRVLPQYLLDEGAGTVAATMAADPSPTAGALAPGTGDEAQVARVLAEVAESFLRFQVVAQREAEQRSELSVAADVVVAVPYFETDICDLDGLLRLGEQIWT